MVDGSRLRSVAACALLALATILPATAAALSREYEVRKVLDTSALGEPRVFDVGPDGAVLVLTGDNILDAGTKDPLFGEPLKNPEWLGFAGKNPMFLVDDELYVVDGRMPRKLLDVPMKDRVFVSDGVRTFLSGVTADGRPLLYLYKEGTGHKALLELDAPVDAMTLARGELYFSAGSRIYALREGGPVRLFANLTGLSRILSLAVDDARGLFFFSDGQDIYAAQGGTLVVVRKNLGGMLRCHAGDLYVLYRPEHALFRLSGLSEAVLSGGKIVSLKDPCEDPVIGLYCLVEKEREMLAAAAELSGSGAADPSGEIAAFIEDRKKEVERLGAALAKEAAAGVEGIVWEGSMEAKAVGANASIGGGKNGARVSLWDGSDLRVGTDSKVVLGECNPSGVCRQTLESGLLYVDAPPVVDGTDLQRPRGFEISAGTVTFGFESGRLSVFSSGDTTAVVVLDGRVRAVSPAEGGTANLAAGEMLEIRPGEPLRGPKAAEMDRVNRWWEKVR